MGDGSGESLFYKAELDVRPPPPRQNYLAGDQCSGTDKAMKEHGWDRGLVVLKRGPKMKAEPSSGGFPPFVPAFRFFALFWTIATTGTGSSSRDPVANRSVPFCVAAKIRRVPSPLRFGPTQ